MVTSFLGHQVLVSVNKEGETLSLGTGIRYQQKRTKKAKHRLMKARKKHAEISDLRFTLRFLPMKHEAKKMSEIQRRRKSEDSKWGNAIEQRLWQK